MISVDIDSTLVKEAYDKLSAKEGICDTLPEVRFPLYNPPHKPNITLVCTHEDAGLNCGAGAEYCSHCLDKEKQYEANKRFSSMLFEKAKDIGVVPKEKEKP